MSIPVIGLESMPNVYFASVSIQNNILEAKLTMKDFIENPTWAESDILRGLLNIKIVALSYDTLPPNDTAILSQGLKRGTTSIHDISGHPIRTLSAHSYIQAETIQTDTVNNFYYNFKLTSSDIDLSKQNIYIFAIAYVDLTSMNLDYASYKFLDGPMASEAVRESGSTPIKGTLFRLDDGTIWTGPVHEHSGNYMEGSFHRQRSHEDLTQAQVESKVSSFIFEINERTPPSLGNETAEAPDLQTDQPNFAGDQQVADPSLDSSTLPNLVGGKDRWNQPIVSQFEEFYHYEQDLDTSSIIVDAVNLALNEFQSARDLFNTNKDYFYELMKDFYIPNFEIRKAPLKRRMEFLDIGTSDWVYDDSLESILVQTSMTDGKFEERYEMRFFSRQYNVNPNNLVEATTNAFDITTKSTFESSKKVGYIKELPSNELFLHNLMIVDEEYFSDESEDYKLKISLDTIDSFKPQLEKTKQEMLSLITDLSVIYSGLFGKLDQQRIINFFAGNGVLINNNLNFISIESQSLFDNSVFSKLSSTLRKVLLAMLSEDQVIEGIISNVLKNLYVNTVSKENYNTVITFLSNLVNRFVTKYNLANTNEKSVLTNTTISRVERKIQKIIEVNRIKNGNFSFFNKPNTHRIITANDMRQRAKDEYDKFFDRQVSAAEISNISPDIGSETSIKMADFETTRFTFFTPTDYRYADKSVDLGQPDITIFDENKHNIITDHMFKINSEAKRLRRKGKAKKRVTTGRSLKRGKTKLLTTLSVRTPFKKSSASGDDSKYENAKDYLGETSPFLSLDLGTRRKELPIAEGPPTLIKKSFAQDRKIKSFQQISLDGQDSALLKNKNNIDFARLPLQFRALVLSNYGLSRFSFALQEENLLQNPKFSTAINNIFNRVRVARYLDGFERKRNGLRIINNPIYLQLDREALDSGKTLVINLSKFSNGVLQVEGDDEIPASNTFVIIEGTRAPASNQLTDQSEIQISGREEKEFSTTNIIKQNEKRQELNGFVNSGEEVQRRAPDPQRRNNVNRRSAIRPTRGNY